MTLLWFLLDSEAPTVTPQFYGAIIPAYNYPSPIDTWNAWINGAPVTKYMIADPGSPGGPGTFTDTNYVAAFAAAQARGITILGYVDTSYTAIPYATVTGQIDLWNTLYGIMNIFFDQTSSGATNLAYYQAISAYARAHGISTIMYNPGVNPDEEYFLSGVADIICVFEGSQTDYNAYTPSSYIASYPSSMVCHLIYGVPSSAAMRDDLARSKAQNAGYVYITDDTLADFPWDDLPTYWHDEVAAMSEPWYSLQATPRRDGTRRRSR